MTVTCTEKILPTFVTATTVFAPGNNPSQSQVDPCAAAQRELTEIFTAVINGRLCEATPSHLDQTVTLALQAPESLIDPLLVVKALLTEDRVIQMLAERIIYERARRDHCLRNRLLEAVAQLNLSQEDKDRVITYILGSRFAPGENPLRSQVNSCIAAQRELTEIFKTVTRGWPCVAIRSHLDQTVTLALQAPGRLIDTALVIEALMTGDCGIRQLVKRIIRETAPNGNRLWAEWLQAVVQSNQPAEDKDRVIHYIIDTFESVEANALTLLHQEFPEVIQYLKQSRDPSLSEHVARYERHLHRDVAHIYSAVVENAPVSAKLRPRHIYCQSKSFRDLYLTHVCRTFALQHSISDEALARLHLNMQYPPPKESRAFQSWEQLVRELPVSERVKQINLLGFYIDTAATQTVYEETMTRLAHTLPPSAMTDVRREWRTYGDSKRVTAPEVTLSEIKADPLQSSKGVLQPFVDAKSPEETIISQLITLLEGDVPLHPYDANFLIQAKRNAVTKKCEYPVIDTIIGRVSSDKLAHVLSRIRTAFPNPTTLRMFAASAWSLGKDVLARTEFDDFLAVVIELQKFGFESGLLPLPPLNNNNYSSVLKQWMKLPGESRLDALRFLNTKYSYFSYNSYFVFCSILPECFTCWRSATFDFVDDLLQKYPSFALQMLTEVIKNLAKFTEGVPQLLDCITKRISDAKELEALGPLAKQWLTKQWLAKPFEEWPEDSSCHKVRLCYHVFPNETFEMLLREFERDPHNLLDPFLQHCQQLGAMKELTNHDLRTLVANECLSQLDRYIDPHKNVAFFWDVFLRFCPSWKQALTTALIRSYNTSLFGVEKAFPDALQLKWHLRQIKKNLERYGLLEEWVNSISDFDLKCEVFEALKA